MVETLKSEAPVDCRVQNELWDAVVIGAGPAGSCCARLLAMDGLRVVLVERERFPRSKVCGGCLSAGGLALLDAIGTGDRLRSLGGNPLARLWLHAAAGATSLPLPPGLALSRPASDGALVQAAQEVGVHFLSGVRALVGRVDGCSRQVELVDCASRSTWTVNAKIVLAGDGLGHPSLRKLPGFFAVPRRQAYLGAGCTLPASTPLVEPGEVHMALGKRGYLGLVRLETGEVNVAAALSPAWLREAGTLGKAAAAVLRSAGLPALPVEPTAWHGTPLLTARANRIAAERLLVIGDAAGFAEPFTGEGMTWAILAACAAEPLARRACEAWRPEIADEWTRTWRDLIGRRQTVCRGIAAGLRQPLAVEWAIRLARCFPRAGSALMRHYPRPVPSFILRSERDELSHFGTGHQPAGPSHEPGPVGRARAAGDLPDRAAGARRLRTLAEGRHSGPVYRSPARNGPAVDARGHG